MVQADWRKKWSEGSMGQTSADFPFGFVNLAPWKNPNNAPASVRTSLLLAIVKEACIQ
jgi:hypothetical protein